MLNIVMANRIMTAAAAGERLAPGGTRPALLVEADDEEASPLTNEQIAELRDLQVAADEDARGGLTPF